jgi:hypothetical protein
MLINTLDLTGDYKVDDDDDNDGETNFPILVYFGVLMVIL